MWRPRDPEGAGSPGAAARALSVIPLSRECTAGYGFPSTGARAAVYKTDVAAAGPDCIPSEAFGQLWGQPRPEQKCSGASI